MVSISLTVFSSLSFCLTQSATRFNVTHLSAVKNKKAQTFVSTSLFAPVLFLHFGLSVVSNFKVSFCGVQARNKRGKVDLIISSPHLKALF